MAAQLVWHWSGSGMICNFSVPISSLSSLDLTTVIAGLAMKVTLALVLAPMVRTYTRLLIGRDFSERTLSSLRRIILTQPNGPVEQKQATNAKGSYRARIGEYNDVMRRVAESTGNLAIDIEEEWVNGSEKAGQAASMLAPDGLHLSLQGHDFYFGVIKPMCLNAARQALQSQRLAS